MLLIKYEKKLDYRCDKETETKVERRKEIQKEDQLYVKDMKVRCRYCQK